jgi:hypothetical protein
MADCLYLYKGKQYTFDQLADILAKGELAKLAENDVIDLTKYKNKSNKDSFQQNMKSAPKKEAVAVEEVVADEPIQKTIDSFNAALESLDTNDLDAVILKVDGDGNLVPSMVAGKKGEAEGLVSKAGDIAWDIDSLNKFTKALNKSFENTSKSKYKLVVSDNAGFNNLHEAYYDMQAPEGTESFVDKERGLIIINGDKATMTAPLHEAAHTWMPWAKEYAPELYKTGLDIIKESETFKQVNELADAYKETFDAAREDNVKKGISRGEATVKARETAAKKVLKTKELKVWEDYFFKSKNFEAEKRSEFLADEILAREVEKEGTVKFTSKLAETFNNWVNKLYDLIGGKLGLKGKTAEEVKNMTLQEFASAIKEEIVNPKRFTEVVKSTKEKLETKLSKQKAAQEKKLETIGLKEEGVAAQAAKKVVEIKMKPITDTKAVNVVKMSNPEFIDNFTKALSKTRLLDEQRKLSLNPEATDADLAETVLGRIMSGELTIPKEAEPIIGKIKGRAPSGLIGEAFKEVADYYNTTPKDVANNIMSIEQQSKEAPTAAPKTKAEPKKARTFDDIAEEIKAIEKQMKEKRKIFDSGKISKEDYDVQMGKLTEKIAKLTDEVMKGEEGFESQKEKVRPAQGYDDNVTFEDTDDGPLYKIGFGRRNEPVDINETKDVVKESNLFKWLTWSKSSLLTAGVDQSLAAGKGYMSYYKKQNLFIAQQMLTKGREFIKEWNSTHPDNKIDGAKFSRVMDSALKGDREAFLSLTPSLRDLVENMRSNIDNLSLAKIASGTLTFAEMDTYYENLGTYVANTYGKYSTTYRGNKLLRKALNVFGVDTKLDWQKEISEEDKLNAFVAISKEVDNGYADTQEQRDSKTSFVQRRKEIERLQKKAEDKSKEISKHEFNEPTDKSTKEWKDWKSKLDRYTSTEAKYTKDYQEKLDSYNKAKEKKVKEIYESIVAEMDGNKNYQSVSNKINKAKFEQRKDIPEWYKNLIKQEDDVYKNYFMTVGKLQESNVTTMMQNQILETGLRNGMVVKDEGEFGDSGQPKFQNYIKVGGQSAVTKQGNTKYGPLYGYKMHPDLYKMMFEVPNINLQASSMNNAMKLAGLTGDVILGASSLINRMKIIYNPSSIMRNFSSHFDSDFKLSGTYWDAFTLSTKMIANGKNLFHQGADYYRSKGLATGEQSFVYFKGLAEDAAKYGASETISQNEFDKLYNQVSGEKSMIKAFDRKGTIDPNAPFTSIMNIAAKCVKYAPKALTTLFLKGDYYPKLIHFELRRQNIAYKAYGNDYYSLTPEQQDNCSRSASANVRQDMAVSDMAGDIANIKFMGIVPKFAYEMQRTFYNAVKNSAGRGIKDQYDFIKWSENPSENEAIIARLNTAHRTRKQLGLAAYTNAIHGMYLIGMALHNKATGKEDKDEEKQTIMKFGQSSNTALQGGESSLYEEIGDWINSDQDNLNPQQAMRAVIPDFLRNHEVYGEYDPQTKKLKYWDAGRNDMYMPAVAPIRGLMYNVNPTQDLNFVESPALGRGLTTIWDVSQSYVGGTILSNLVMEKAFSKEAESKNWWTKTSEILQGSLPSDLIAYRKTLEQAKYNETSFVDANGKYFDDNFVKGLQGRYFEIPVDKKIRSNMKVITDSYSEEIKDVIKSINGNITKISGGKNFFGMSNQQRYDEMNKPKMKEYIKVAEQQLNETSRKFVKDLRFYYLSAKKFGFTEEEINDLLNKKEMNLLDMGLLKAMPLYRSKDFDGNIKSLLQLKNNEIDQLDFSNLIEDKTYYIDK